MAGSGSKQTKTADELASMIWIEARATARAPAAAAIKVSRLHDSWIATCSAPGIDQHAHFIAAVARVSERLRQQYELVV
jgi:hypothetical protein